MNIRTKLLIGFLTVIVFSVTTGIYSTSAIDKTSALTKELYDHPLMASSFAMTTTVDFERADRALGLAALDGAGAGLHQQAAAIAVMEMTLGQDLDVVEERFPGGRGAEMVDAVRRL